MTDVAPYPPGTRLRGTRSRTVFTVLPDGTLCRMLDNTPDHVHTGTGAGWERTRRFFGDLRPAVDYPPPEPGSWHVFEVRDDDGTVAIEGIFASHRRAAVFHGPTEYLWGEDGAYRDSVQHLAQILLHDGNRWEPYETVPLAWADRLWIWQHARRAARRTGPDWRVILAATRMLLDRHATLTRYRRELSR